MCVGMCVRTCVCMIRMGEKRGLGEWVSCLEQGKSEELRDSLLHMTTGSGRHSVS